MFSAQKKLVLVSLVILIGLFVIQGCAISRPSWKASKIEHSALPALLPDTATQTSPSANVNTYKNAELGFQFQYLADWTVRENTFRNYYSRFNLEVVPPGKIDLFDPILINVVLPEFVDYTFSGLRASTSEIIVDGVSGVKYEYEFEGTPEIDIVLPFKQNRMIIGTKKKYEDAFSQIVASFKFLH